GAISSTAAPAARSVGTRRCATRPPPTTTTRRPARRRPRRYGGTGELFRSAETARNYLRGDCWDQGTRPRNREPTGPPRQHHIVTISEETDTSGSSRCEAPDGIYPTGPIRNMSARA